MTRTPVILALLALALPTRAADWPQFRGPTGQGISTATDIPTEWSAAKNVAWKAPIPGSGWSSPVLADGRIYLTTGISDNTAPSLRALCLDASSGKVLWDTQIFQPPADQFRVMHSKNSPASPTPIVDGERLYVHFGHLGTAALDRSGNVLWRQQSLNYPPAHGNGGSPALVNGDTLIFSCDGSSNPFLAALDARTGDVKWKSPRVTATKKLFSFSTPLAIEVDGATQLISPASGFVGAYDPRDGRELWRVRYGDGYSVIPRPVFAHGLVLVSSGYDTAVMFAIRPQEAAGDVTATHVAWQNKKAAPNTPSPLVVGDELYLVSDAGMASCSDVRTGDVHWTQRLEGNFSASPVSAEGRVYFQSEEGIGYVVKAAKTYELIAENDLKERSLASYAIADSALFIRTANHLWKIAR